jgi:hypothetical protein
MLIFFEWAARTGTPNTEGGWEGGLHRLVLDLAQMLLHLRQIQTNSLVENCQEIRAANLKMAEMKAH